MKVGVIIPTGKEDNVRQPMSYGTARLMALQAEAAGFHSIKLPDHLFFRFPNQRQFGVWESWAVLTGLAEATTRVEIGALVMCGRFQNPALLAKIAVMADDVSRGCVILSLGADWHEPEFNAFGILYERLRSYSLKVSRLSRRFCGQDEWTFTEITSAWHTVNSDLAARV